MFENVDVGLKPCGSVENVRITDLVASEPVFASVDVCVFVIDCDTYNVEVSGMIQDPSVQDGLTVNDACLLNDMVVHGPKYQLHEIVTTSAANPTKENAMFGFFRIMF